MLNGFRPLKDALDACDQAIKINPKSNSAWQYKASIYIEQKDTNNAMKCLTKLIELNPGNSTNYHVRANYYLEQGKYDLAIQDLNHAVKIQSEDTEPLIIRGDAYRAIKRYTEAIADYSKAIKMDEPRCGAAIYGRSLCERALGKIQEADRDLKRSQYFDYEPTAKKAPPKLLPK
ncbi:MAG: tetratricopeptide repeat protein [Candidatus Melainabacteria bacterium]|nr:tetratricopeptide repeat protein [Candidatus Melainabacteria bacterium]